MSDVHARNTHETAYEIRRKVDREPFPSCPTSCSRIIGFIHTVPVTGTGTTLNTLY